MNYRCPIWLPHLGDKVLSIQASSEEEAQRKAEAFVRRGLEARDESVKILEEER